MAIARNPKVIMTDRQFVERLTIIKNRNTFYKNKYPYNLCYINKDGRTSADCSNLVKAILNGYDVYKNEVGYYQKDLSNTGDCSEAELLCQCTDVTDDFSNMGEEPRILWMNKPNGHIGVYLGKSVDNRYNVIECTKSAFGNGVIYSWVDKDGTRRSENGGKPIIMSDGTYNRWMKNGLPTKWVEMTGNQKQESPKEPTSAEQKVYFVKTGDTMSKIAEKFGMSLAKLCSYNPQIRNINLIRVGQVIYLSSKTIEEYYTVVKGDTFGGIARKFNMSLNKLKGLNPDIKNYNLIQIGQKIRIK